LKHVNPEALSSGSGRRGPIRSTSLVRAQGGCERKSETPFPVRAASQGDEVKNPAATNEAGDQFDTIGKYVGPLAGLAFLDVPR